MERQQREELEDVLGRIRKSAWDEFLASPQGAHLQVRLEHTRAILRRAGLLPSGAPPRPIDEVIDLLGYRLLSDAALGPWLRHQILLTLPAKQWERLAEAYRRLEGSRHETLHGNASQGGRGSEVMARRWHQGSRWARRFCETVGLPGVLAETRHSPFPEDEDVIPAIPLPDLHAFQREAYDKLRALLKNGKGQAALMSLPTGAGKTRIAVEAICDHLVTSRRALGGGNLVLWIAQSHELQEQAWACFRNVWQAPSGREEETMKHRAIPLRLVRAWGGRKPEEIEFLEGPMVLVAGIDQLASWARNHPEFFEEFPRHRLACVALDEAHGLVTSEYREVLGALGLKDKRQWRLLQSSPPFLGLSATPWRRHHAQDDSLRSFFQHQLITPELLGDDPIRSLQERKILARVVPQEISVEEALLMSTTEHQRYQTFHDLPAEYLTRLGDQDPRNASILRALMALSPGTRTLVFACSVEHAETLTLALNRASGDEVAAVVTARTPRAQRAALLERFREKDSPLRFLCNVGVLTTGFDAPKIEAVCLTRPTASKALYEQMIGRGLRGPLNGGTKTCQLLEVRDKEMPEEILSYARVRALWTRVPEG